MHSVWMVVAAVLALQVDVLSNRLLEQRGAVEDEEVAAFIVRRSDGALELVHWPRARGFRTASWRGPLPESTIGIIHTHPASVPRPSMQDIAESRRLRLPFYVVSRRLLCTIGVDGQVSCKSKTAG